MRAVQYTFSDSTRYVNATEDNGVEWQGIDLENESELQHKVQYWIDQGNTPEPCDDDAPPVPPMMLAANKAT